jgi:hypothetical protein
VEVDGRQGAFLEHGEGVACRRDEEEGTEWVTGEDPTALGRFAGIFPAFSCLAGGSCSVPACRKPEHHAVYRLYERATIPFALVDTA